MPLERSRHNTRKRARSYRKLKLTMMTLDPLTFFPFPMTSQRTESTLPY